MFDSNKQILVIRHYFRLKPVKCTLISGDTENFFTTKSLETVKMHGNIIKGDPIIFGVFQEDNNIKISGGSIITTADHEGNIIISPDKAFSSLERRQHERFPVSLLACLRHHDRIEKNRFAYIKDISYSGFRIYTEVDLQIEDEVEVDIYLHNRVLSVVGMVVRKSTCYSRNEYGIQIIFRDKSAIYAIRESLDGLVAAEKELLIKHLLI